LHSDGTIDADGFAIHDRVAVDERCGIGVFFGAT